MIPGIEHSQIGAKQLGFGVNSYFLIPRKRGFILLIREPREESVLMTAKTALRSIYMLAPPFKVSLGPHDDCPGFLESCNGGNIVLKKGVIRWISDLLCNTGLPPWTAG